jgi:hypothetical protein
VRSRDTEPLLTPYSSLLILQKRAEQNLLLFRLN